jgi:hypothetical protein
MRSIAWIAFGGAFITTLAGNARADVVGSFEGALVGKAGSVRVATVFKQVERFVTGTVALPGDLETFGGEYLVTGKATPTRIKFSGGGGDGAFLKGNLKAAGGTLRGKIKVKAPGVRKLTGTTTLTQNVSTGDGSTCDAVYQANQTLFDEQVLDDALTICTTCHAEGFEAEATRLRVDLTDPLPTARSVAQFVDAANPAASKLLTKPLNLVPHGGGVQITPDSPEEQLLEQWVALVAAAQCN